MTDQLAATSGQEPPNAAATAPITVEQAAAVLGVSVTTVKRRIRTGALRGEQAQRPQGTVWLVYLDPAATPAVEERPPAASVAATAAATPTAQAEAMVSLIQTTIGTVLGPLVAELAASRQTVERQADQLVAQAGTIGRLEAENAALRVTHSPVQPNLTPDPGAWLLDAPGARSWRSGRWLVVLAGIVLAIGAVWLLVVR
jgi:excisionase family DNA binding protein